MKILHKNLPRLVRLAADWKIKGNSIVLPQHYVPDGVVVGSDEDKIFLFYFCFLTPRSHSSVLIKKIDLLIKDGIKVERLFDELTLTSERHIPFFKRQIGWMKKCQESLGGIENISRFDSDYESVDEFIKSKSFPGWGPKLYSLYRMTLEELVSIKAPDDTFPVDVHTISMLSKFGIFKMEGHSRCIKTVSNYIRREISIFLKEKDLKAWEVHNPIWYLGSVCCAACTKDNLLCKIDFCSREHSNSNYWRGILKA